MTLTGRRKGAGLYPDTGEQPSPLLVKRLLLRSCHWVTDLKVNEVSYTQHTSSLDRMRAPRLMGGWLSAYIIISAKNPSELSQKPEGTGQRLRSLLRASCCCWRASRAATPPGPLVSGMDTGVSGGSCLILEKRQPHRGAPRFVPRARQELSTSARVVPHSPTPPSVGYEPDAETGKRDGRCSLP